MFKKLLLFVLFFFSLNLLVLGHSVSASNDSLTSPNFTIKTSSIMPGGEKIEWTTVKQKVNFLLWTIIQKLMIALGAIALLIMTIGWGYMIFYHWQDEFLSKGKSIFMSWIISLIVALSSYYIISLIRFILYSNS